jgi:hypothetical protein
MTRNLTHAGAEWLFIGKRTRLSTAFWGITRQSSIGELEEGYLGSVLAWWHGAAGHGVIAGKTHYGYELTERKLEWSMTGNGMIDDAEAPAASLRMGITRQASS